MALGPRLDLRQSQALVMTPQLQQAIKLLQMNNLELNLYVDQELEQNPLLEREEPDGGTDAATESTDGDTRDTAAGEDGAAGDMIELRRRGEREAFIAEVTGVGEAMLDLGRRPQ